MPPPPISLGITAFWLIAVVFGYLALVSAHPVSPPLVATPQGSSSNRHGAAGGREATNVSVTPQKLPPRTRCYFTSRTGHGQMIDT